ncbi:universal stress protein [Natranaeroarchaeum sulfidigenes]|uniref:Nucleotide-binding protein, UspA family n=1 Tax=Natranaeroarchaeum sulfidigenes TaxID=2784880 RepID=A0A897MH92_9EURY|nr:universal stress protein [Natranaeroarchaeum sulfidigenes]QSG01520.1 Nucleotide-binding protein, UspA family [Natranaeroarchaeum sulfidigenes]
MYEILMPIDTSESRGRKQAAFVTALPGASESIHVSLLYVFDDENKAETTAPRQLSGGNAAFKRLREANVGIEQVSRIGKPAEQIVSVAEELDADLLVLGGRKHSPGRSALFGSVTQSVIRQTERPVTVTGGEAAET